MFRSIAPNARQFVLAIISLTIISNSFCQTNVNGNQIGTWTLAGSPYILNGNVSIPEGETLTIEPGVEVHIIVARYINIYGILIAEGSTQDSIKFIGFPNASYSHGGAVIFRSSSIGSRISYARIDKMGERDLPDPNDGRAIWIQSSDVEIRNSEIKNSDLAGIYIDDNVTPVIEECNFRVIPSNIPIDTVTLCWSAVDDTDGVGVGTYDLYVSKDREQYYLYEPDIDTTCYLFVGDLGSTYAFYIRSKDLVGNQEPLPDGPQMQVTLGGTVELTIKVMLQGPYNSSTGLMNSDLQSSGLISIGEPYGTGNGELTTQTVLDFSAVESDMIVDWVLVELRSSLTEVAETRAALLQRDGDVVDVDGVSPV